MKAKNKTIWRRVKLGDFVKVNPSVQLQRGKVYPFLDMADVQPLSRTTNWPKTKVFNGSGARFENGDTLFARITPCLENGKITQVFNLDGAGFGSTEFYVLQGKDGISDSDFIYYLSRTYRIRKLAEQSMIGASGRQRVERAAFENIEIEIPKDINIQKRIADILSAFDDKIELNNKISKNLEQMAQTIFKEWFVKFRFPGHEKVKLVDSELGKIPEGWEMKRMKDVAQIKKGLSYSSTEIKEKDEGLPLINLANFKKGGGYNPAGIKFYTGRYGKDRIVKSGDIVIAMTDLTSNREVIGHPARVPINSWGEILISLDVCVLAIDELYREYLYYLMLRKHFSYQMASSAGGTNVAHLSKSAIEEYEFVLPTRNILEQFRNFVDDIFQKQNVIEVENQKLAALRDLLLPKLMNNE